MGVQKETLDMLLLLSTVSERKNELSEVFIQQIKKTPEYRVMTNLDEYEFVSGKAKEVRDQFQSIHIEKGSVAEINKELHRLQQIYTNFQNIVSDSKRKIKAGNYQVGIVSKKGLQELKSTDRSLYEKISIMARSSRESEAEAFRDYLLRSNQQDIAEEYERIRPSSLLAKDNTRARLFLVTGGVLFALFFMLILSIIPRHMRRRP